MSIFDWHLGSFSNNFIGISYKINSLYILFQLTNPIYNEVKDEMKRGMISNE